MKRPEDWLDEQIGDRPEDFSDEDIEKALWWIRRVQRDAVRTCILRGLIGMLLGLAILAVIALIWGGR